MADLQRVYSPSGAYFSVAKPYAGRFADFLKALEGAGYRIDQGQSGGYNYRNIAGTNRLSNHAHGSAIDINWSQNPRSTSSPYGHIGQTLGADKVRSLAAAHGLKWGGDWKNPDAMHFEIDHGWGGGGEAQQQPAHVEPASVQTASSPWQGATGYGLSRPQDRPNAFSAGGFTGGATWLDPNTVRWSDGSTFNWSGT